MSWKNHYEIPEEWHTVGTVKVTCKHCQTLISGNVQTTSNFSTHLKRKHRHELLSGATSDDSEKQQQNINLFVNKKVMKYGATDPKQKEVTDALVHVIAGTLSPLSLVDSPDFKHFVSSLDPRYEIPSRKQLSTKHLNSVFLDTENKLKKKLNSVENICLTIDLWSNRQMRGFLGITGHFILNWQMESVMIACKRFKGRHTAENIWLEYEEALAACDISDKITNVTTDNASNMKKALNFSLPAFPSKCEALEKEESGEETESDSEIDESDTQFPEDNFPVLGHCFAHTLQLVVKDGLKESNQHLRNVIAKLEIL